MKALLPIALAAAILFLGAASADYGDESGARRCTHQDKKVDAHQEKKEFEKRVRLLMKHTSAAQTGKETKDKMVDALRGTSGLPEGFADKFAEIVEKSMIQ